MLDRGKHKLHVLDMALEDGYVTAKSVSKHLGINEINAAMTLNYYSKREWLKKIPTILKKADPSKKNHYCTSYDITPDGKLELERLRRIHG